MSKSTRWQFTAYEGQWYLFKKMPGLIAEWGWQEEICPDTGRRHYQGYLRTHQQQRLNAVCRMLPGVHLEVARDWLKTKNYCKKEETRAPGTVPFAEVSDHPNLFSYCEDLVSRLPTWQQIFEACQTHNTAVSYSRRYDQFEYSDLKDLPMERKMYQVEEFAYEVVLKEQIRKDIHSGLPVEFIIQNPLFISTLRHNLRDLIFRRDHPYSPPSIQDRQTDTTTVSFD